MATSDSNGLARGSDVPDDDLTDFLGLLNELRSTGCNLLVAGDAPREVFTRASAAMLGDDDAVRYRTLAVTDATPKSVADRLPDPETSPRSVGETTHVLNHAGALRPVTAATGADTPPELASVRETRIADPRLDGLQSALVDAIGDFASRADTLRPADLRVGVDSLEPLLDCYGEDVVRRCLRLVGGHVRRHDAMAHYVLPKPRESEAVRSLAEDADAVVELRLADSESGQTAEQRWHVPDRDLTVGWIPL